MILMINVSVITYKTRISYLKHPVFIAFCANLTSPYNSLRSLSLKTHFFSNAIKLFAITCHSPQIFLQ